MKSTRVLLAVVLSLIAFLQGCSAHVVKNDQLVRSRVTSSPMISPASADNAMDMEAQRTGIYKPRKSTRFFAMTAGLPSLRPRRADEIRVHFLPIGTGSCQLVECPGSNSTPMLVDCGTSGGSQLDEDSVLDYVQRIVGDQRVNVVVSHPDNDHVNLIYKVLNPEQIRSIWLGSEYDEYMDEFKYWVDSIRASDVSPKPTVFQNLPENWHNNSEAVADLACGTADTFVLGGQVGNTANEQSLMLAIQYGDFSVVFPGDATGKSQEAAIANFPDAMNTTVLVASHHGAGTEHSNESPWPEATQPWYVIYSAGSMYQHPTCKAVDTYRAIGSLVPVSGHKIRCGTTSGWTNSNASRLAEYNTAVSGLIVITAGKKQEEVEIYCGSSQC